MLSPDQGSDRGALVPCVSVVGFLCLAGVCWWFACFTLGGGLSPTSLLSTCTMSAWVCRVQFEPGFPMRLVFRGVSAERLLVVRRYLGGCEICPEHTWNPFPPSPPSHELAIVR